jgi:carbon monoxide dehydrogenase subunit G
MESSAARLITAPKERVWAALNDPDILKACLPGCETLEKRSDTEWETAASVTLGAAIARFTGTALLSDLNPPNGYTISLWDQEGESNRITGRAKVALSDEAGGTRLSYQLEKQDGRPADSAAQEVAARFFTRFAELLGGSLTEPVYHLVHEDHDHDPSNPHYFGLPLGVIIAGVIAAAAVGITVAKFFL